MIRVVIVDDHGVVRDGLARLIDALDDMTVVGTAADGIEAVELCTREQPAVALMDIEMPRMDGIEATRAIRRDAPGVAVLVLTSFSDRGAHPRRARGRRLRLPAQGRRRRPSGRRRPRRLPR